MPSCTYTARLRRHNPILHCYSVWLRAACLALTIATIGTAWAQAQQFSLQFEAPHAPDRIIVRYQAASAPGATNINSTSIAASRAAVHQALSATGHALLTADGRTELIRLPTSASVGTAILQLRTRGDVEYAEPDFKVSIATEPNDPSYADGSLWGMNNSGQNGPDGGGTANADINAPEGWSLRHDALQVVVAVIDTGIRRTHQDLAANMWENTGEIVGNGIDDDGNGYVDDRYGLNAITYTGSDAGDPMDDNGHGTHVAGTIGAVGNNGIGVAGVAWGVRLMACKFLNSGGAGYISDAIECIDYARVQGADVINASWGGGGHSRALRDAIEQAYESGIVFVTAAGNNATNNDEIDVYPANLGVDNIVAVAALNRRGVLAYFSNWGQHSVPIAAPGDWILSSHNASDAAYEYLSGTSMASPHVAGVMAMLRAHFPDEPVNRLINRLYRSARTLPDLAGKVRTGGIVDLAAALTSTNPAPTHDDRTGALRIFASGDGANFEIFGTNDAATRESGELLHAGNSGGASVWYKFVARRSGIAEFTVASTGTFQPILGVYVASATDELVPVAGAVADSNLASIAIGLQAGRTYFFAIDGVGGNTGRFFISAQQRPTNDDFAEARPLVGPRGLVTQYADGATAEVDEPPASEFYVGGSSTWYTWTAPESGRYTFRVLANNPSSGPLIAFYTGDSLANLTRAYHMDLQFDLYFYWGGEMISGLTTSAFQATAGNTYHIQVDGLDWTPSGLGNLRLYWDPTPPNDSYDTRQTLSGAAGSIAGHTSGATGGYWVRPTYGRGARDVWFRWIAPVSGMVTFDTTSGTDWDTTLELFSGPDEPHLQLLASNDDGSSGLQSVLSCYVQAGVEYAVCLNGFSLGVFPSLDTPSGAYRLNWSFIPDSSPPTASFTLSSERQAGQTLTVNLNVGDPNGDLAFANLWVYSPISGWRALKTDNTLVAYSGRTPATATTTTAGTFARTFALNEGAGTYLFALAAVDATSLTTQTETQAITVTSANNSAPTASFTLSSERQTGQTLTVNLNVSDPDGNLAFANLWVYSPISGWRALKADNTLVAYSGHTPATATTTTAGTFARTFALNEGAGTYLFALAAVDAAGLITQTETQAITVTSASNQAPTASFTLSSERQTGQTLTVNLNVSDPDGNLAFANLWVYSPISGWRALKADNTLVAYSGHTPATATTATAGAFARTFALNEGAGTYLFALAAVDAAGLTTQTITEAITVTAASNSAPTASFSLSGERQTGQTLTINLAVGDPDGNLAFANLWVYSPISGWRALKADNSLVTFSGHIQTTASASTTGSFARSFTLSEGAGTYLFALAAVDSAGLITQTGTEAITVTAW